MSPPEFEAKGFDQLLTQLKETPSNDAWLGPLQTCSALIGSSDISPAQPVALKTPPNNCQPRLITPKTA
ncbi:hypothetical protein AQS70_15705 [Pseudomonas endophytica]|uniref:Uncharacterized protein n=1 Tax=Pseudomonas endophytica TaxID=1563157 RepID=A0A0Q0XQ84_9PSED|nr:hypothetical protein [Pseudomonas endophytica]KQB52171.1 hypothetical protein AQS70_15705 [Pseudomonas endophytica]